MNKESKIYVAGHRGLVGSAIMANLKSKGYKNVIGRTHSELDLLDQRAVAEFLTANAPMPLYWRPHTLAASWPTASIAPTSSGRILRFSKT